MTTLIEGTFAADLDPDEAHGGTIAYCTLKLAGGKFELHIKRRWIYSIEEGNTIRGTYAVEDDCLILQAREHHVYTWETVKQESSNPISRKIIATVTRQTEDLPGMHEMKIGIDWPVKVQLLSLAE